MKNLAINPTFISDNNTFSFKEVPTMYKGFFDVYFKGERIAIINGLSSPLQWTKSSLPIKIIDQLEKMVVRMLKQSAK